MKPIEKLDVTKGYPHTSLYSKINEIIDAVEKRQPYHCPVCGEKGEKLIKRIWHGAIGNISQDVVFDTKRIYACPKCHSLFWEDV